MIAFENLQYALPKVLDYLDENKIYLSGVA
jgi:hypothetical protein